MNWEAMVEEVVALLAMVCNTRFHRGSYAQRLVYVSFGTVGSVHGSR